MTQAQFTILPNSNIHSLAPVAELDFFDSQSIQLSAPIAPLKAWNIIRANPLPGLKLAFGIRDAISTLFGAKAISGFSEQPVEDIQTGDMLDFFRVEHISQDVLTLTVRDSHLDVMTCVSTSSETLTITSSVQTHNGFGRAYMIPVAPAHRLIVRHSLKCLRRSMSNGINVHADPSH